MPQAAQAWFGGEVGSAGWFSFFSTASSLVSFGSFASLGAAFGSFGALAPHVVLSVAMRHGPFPASGMSAKALWRHYEWLEPGRTSRIVEAWKSSRKKNQVKEASSLLFSVLEIVTVSRCFQQHAGAKPKSKVFFLQSSWTALSCLPRLEEVNSFHSTGFTIARSLLKGQR